MANEIRLRRNNESGTITDNPLTIGATTINSAGFASLPTIGATNSMILILDPQEVGGTAEIVRVTAHTAAATSVTVVRGQEGSVARSHVFNTTWMHGPVTSDYIEVLTSSTRPSVPYEGELIYETDTNKFVGFGGTDWAPRDAGGSLGVSTSTSNAVTSGTTELTLFTVGVTVGSGRLVRVTLYEPNNVSSVGAGEVFEFHIEEDGITKQNYVYQALGSNTQLRAAQVEVVLAPTPGAHTYTGTVTRIGGTGTLTMTRSSSGPGFLLVEDIGAA